MIKALHESGVVPSCFDETTGFSQERLRGQLKLAEQAADRPSGLLTGSTTIGSLAGATHARTPARAPPSPSTLPAHQENGSEEWQCPLCGVLESQTDLTKKAPFALLRPCIQNAGCFCEGLAPETEYCSLCVRFFKRNHQRRSKKTEQNRILKRRQSGGTPGRGSNKRPRIKEDEGEPPAARGDDAASVVSL